LVQEKISNEIDSIGALQICINGNRPDLIAAIATAALDSRISTDPPSLIVPSPVYG
jgi:hypothetical protein